MRSDGIYGGKAKSQRCVLKYFLQVATEMTLGTDKLLSLFDLSEREGSDAASMG